MRFLTKLKIEFNLFRYKFYYKRWSSISISSEIVMEEDIELVYDRWQRQPQDEEEQREMEREMREVESPLYYMGEEKKNTLGEWSDSDDNWIQDVEEKKNTLGEWSDSDDNWIWDVEENVQVGRGRKRKSDEVNEGASTSSASNEVNEGTSTSSTLPEDNFYVVENVKQTRSKKFRMSAMDYSIRFNNTENKLDLIQGYERTQEIFEHLLNDITGGMNEKDQVRFVLRSEQLDTPISLPFMPVRTTTYT